MYLLILEKACHSGTALGSSNYDNYREFVSLIIRDHLRSSISGEAFNHLPCSSGPILTVNHESTITTKSVADSLNLSTRTTSRKKEQKPTLYA